MEPIANATLTQPTELGPNPALGDMGTQDFLKLLVTQLTNQDPLEPTGNEELLRQISSIREIELSTTLTDSLRNLTGQQHYGAASSLIGQYVTGLPDGEGNAERGQVVGVRFDDQGQAQLLLSSGAELPLQEVSTIETPLRAAQALEGMKVMGIDRNDQSSNDIIEGIVTSARPNDAGEIVLELDSGHALRLIDVIAVSEG